MSNEIGWETERDKKKGDSIKIIQWHVKPTMIQWFAIQCNERDEIQRTTSEKEVKKTIEFVNRIIIVNTTIYEREKKEWKEWTKA